MFDWNEVNQQRLLMMSAMNYYIEMMFDYLLVEMMIIMMIK
jgi:hypothetical protein